MAARVRAYDVETSATHVELPSWAHDFEMDHVPFPGDEMRFEVDDGRPTNRGKTPSFWMVIRRQYAPAQAGGGVHVTLGLRFVSR